MQKILILQFQFRRKEKTLDTTTLLDKYQKSLTCKLVAWLCLKQAPSRNAKHAFVKFCLFKKKMQNIARLINRAIGANSESYNKHTVPSAS